MDVSMMGRVDNIMAKVSWSEILKCLNELGFSVSREEVLKPEEHKDTVRRLLEGLAEVCVGTSREEWAQPGFAGLNAINYPELHEDSIPHLNSLRAIMKMMEICDVRDFALRDLANPTSNRLHRQLACIINFCKFREERLQLLTHLNETRAGLLDSLAAQQEKNEALNNRLSLLRTQTAEEGEQVLQLETDIRDLHSRAHELRRTLDALEAKNNHDGNSHQRLVARNEEIKAQYEELCQTESRLRGQVVTSPEKFRKQILEVGQTLQHEQKDAKVAEKRVQQLSAWLVHLEEAQSEVTLALDHITDIRHEVDRQKALIHDLDAAKQEVQSLVSSVSEHEQREKVALRSVQRMEQNLQNLRKTATARATETQRQQEQLHAQVVEAEQFRVQLKGKAERLEAESKRVEKELETESAAWEQEITEVVCAYQQVERHVMRHLQNLQKAMATTAVSQSEGSPSQKHLIGGGVEAVAGDENRSPFLNQRVIA